MNTISVAVVNQQTINTLDSVRNLGIFLNKCLLQIKMNHWFTEDYNAHQIIGNLYEDLDDLFDKLVEEIIGTSKSQGKLFPVINLAGLDIDNLTNYSTMNGENMNTFNKVCQTLLGLFCSHELNDYVQSVNSGINNTKEEIVSSINKSLYLLTLVKL